VSAAPSDPAALLAGLGVPVRALETDSRAVQPGDVFVAVPGRRDDGRLHIAQAVAAGAVAVLWEDADGFAWPASLDVPHRGVHDLHARVGALAAHVYNRPSEALWVAGVTGTNGKTTCSHWIARGLARAGRARTAVIGTLGNGFPDALEPATHTTPDAVALQRAFAQARDSGAQAVAMEVSSHALDQDRVDGVTFDTALFTNLTRDHLDYHGTMQAYGDAKAKLFVRPELTAAVLNLDDPFGDTLAARIDAQRVRVLRYGFGRGDIAAHDVDLSTRGLRLEIRTAHGARAFENPRVLGRFNVSNLLGTLGVLLSADVSLGDACDALADVAPVPGRLELVRAPHAPLVVVDYAHTPDALEQVLHTLRDLAPPHGRLVCVFGCGGERDAGKRPLMGAVATRGADLAIVTSDNPRGEDPEAIATAVVAGSRPNHVVELDRARAIALALSWSRPDDVVLVAGKGHETTQEIAGVKHPFSDVAVARRALGLEAVAAVGTQERAHVPAV
jgi:UDP-N-acetylmuramoyl-L-alanyl-D-glutamate--2,6-diaminopimelate ligase